MMATEVSPIF